MKRKLTSSLLLTPLVGLLSLVALGGCSKPQVAHAAGQPMPVKTQTVNLAPVARSDSYVATIKSRRSATIQPQVDGSLSRILVKSGDHVRPGQPLMTIDPLKQQAAVDQQKSTETQKKAIYDYNKTELDRQTKLYEAGVASKQNYDQAVQAFENSKADWEAATAGRVTQQRQLAYYTLTAPFAGIVGDIPVHIGDYVSPTTVLTTVDENADLEAYIYIPVEESSRVHMGLPVRIVTSQGDVLDTTKIDFVAQQVDNAIQGLLVKAPVHGSLDKFRNAQLVKAEVIWSTNPTPTVPVLAVTRIGGQAFVYVATDTDKGTVAKQRAIALGDTVGNDYSVSSGLQPGDRVIVSGTQFLVDGAPVKPLG